MTPAMDAEIIAHLRERSMYAEALRVKGAFDASAAVAHLTKEAEYFRENWFASETVISEMIAQGSKHADAIRDEALEEAAQAIFASSDLDDAGLSDYGRDAKRLAWIIRALKSPASATGSHHTAPSAPPPPADSGETLEGITGITAADVKAMRMAAAKAHSDRMDKWRAEREGTEDGWSDGTPPLVRIPLARDWDDWSAEDVGR